jgi:hypothetical protein
MKDERKIRFQGAELGSFSIDHLYDMALGGEIDYTAEFWSPGEMQWRPLAGIIFDIEPCRISEMKSAEVLNVKILGSGDDCPSCKTLEGTVYPIDEVPALPPVDCRCVPWCRSMVVATAETPTPRPSVESNVPNYDPVELLRLCESILEDGEIDETEIYRLAEWLNDNRNACFHWPGDLLVKPLQAIWADGKVTKTELRQIGRLLIQIQREWAKRQSTEAFEKATELVEQMITNLDLTRPQLPLVPFATRVKSHTSKGLFYDVDLSGPTCTCLDWTSYRHNFSQGHLTRCCKHILDVYSQLEPDTGWPSWLGAFFDFAWTPHPRQDWVILAGTHELVLASTAPNGWANVFVDDGGGYDRFGYNVVEHRWAYGIAPSESERIIRAVRDFVVQM